MEEEAEPRRHGVTRQSLVTIGRGKHKHGRQAAMATFRDDTSGTILF